MGAKVIQDADTHKAFSMICHIASFRNRKFNSVNEAVEVIKDYFVSETSFDVKLVYFMPYNDKEELFMLKFLLSGVSEQDKQSIVILDGIAKDEADESWITIFK